MSAPSICSPNWASRLDASRAWTSPRQRRTDRPAGGVAIRPSSMPSAIIGPRSSKSASSAIRGASNGPSEPDRAPGANAGAAGARLRSRIRLRASREDHSWSHGASSGAMRWRECGPTAFPGAPLRLSFRFRRCEGGIRPTLASSRNLQWSASPGQSYTAGLGTRDNPNSGLSAFASTRPP